MPAEPDIAAQLADIAREIKILGLEMRAGFAESRARDADISSRLNTLVDSITDLRNEYRGHTHTD